MEVISYSQTRQNLKKIFDKVVNNSQPAFIKRKNGENVVIISEVDYLSLNETAYLLKNPANKSHLESSLGNLIKKESTTFNSLEDLDNAI